MRQSIRIAGQIRRSVFYEGWHGPAVLEVLQGLDAAQAALQTPVAKHSIWQLVRHMCSWQELALGATEGRPFPDNAEADLVGWEKITDLSPNAWKKEVDRFRDSADKLSQRAATLEDRRLTEQVPGRAYDMAHMLLGIASHNTYHCGQIVLIHRYIHLHPA
jgi:uncharacterized damage-inducible protein DinB